MVKGKTFDNRLVQRGYLNSAWQDAVDAVKPQFVKIPTPDSSGTDKTR
jgi:hypothetical protein